MTARARAKALALLSDIPSRGATLSIDGKYRYRLWRDLSVPATGWTLGVKRGLVFVALNPSIADHNIDDPTIRRMVGFAKDLGYDWLEVVNLFAYRATDPKELKTVIDPIGGVETDMTISTVCQSRNTVICAWGANPAVTPERVTRVLDLIRGHKNTPMALAVTKSGAPSHPLYLRRGLKPFPWSPR